jgi:aminoglycoside phosphotransferase (APT) family kinase protein
MSAGFAAFKSAGLGDLVDEVRLAAWLDTIGVAPGVPLRVRRISGGLSNESIGVERGGERYVLRRPAKRALEGADRGMRREFRVLGALEGTPVPHPRPIALCEDASVADGVAYLMEHVDGFAPAFAMPEPFASDAALRREIPLAAMTALGALARVDWRARGLADFGRPEGFHERQVARWGRQLAGYDASDRDLSGLHEVGAWLEGHRPGDDTWTPGIMHGDYHLANVFVAPAPPARIAAILDWENATIGDPVLDLATFLHLRDARGRAHWGERDALIARWEEASGRRAPDLRYWTALAAFKLAILVEGVRRRALADPTRGKAEGLNDTVLSLARDARDAAFDAKEKD